MGSNKETLDIIENIIEKDSDSFWTLFLLEKRSIDENLNARGLFNSGIRIDSLNKKFNEVFNEFIIGLLNKIVNTFKDLNISLNKNEITYICVTINKYCESIVNNYINLIKEIKIQLGCVYDEGIIQISLLHKVNKELELFEIQENNRRNPRSIIEQIKANKIATLSLITSGLSLLVAIGAIVVSIISLNLK